MTTNQDINSYFDPNAESVEHKSDESYKQQEIDHLHAQTEDLKQMTQLRMDYANRVFTFLIIWSIGVGFVLIFSSSSFWIFNYFEIPNTVLSILVGSTTINAIGLVEIITKGLFKVPSQKNKEQ